MKDHQWAVKKLLFLSRLFICQTAGWPFREQVFGYKKWNTMSFNTNILHFKHGIQHRLQSDLNCVRWGVKLYSLTCLMAFSK